MSATISEDTIRSFASEKEAEAKALLRTLGKIPAPSHDEGRRAEAILSLLHGMGAKEAYIDGAKNVLYPYQIKGNEPFALVMAHTDVVFPDTEPLPMEEHGSLLYAPGIGDDTANVVTMLTAIQFLLEHPGCIDGGILFAANACEEGLGNLDGCKQIFSDFNGRINRFLSFDGNPHGITNRAVGSVRCRLTIKAQGGHSYWNYGNTNAIAQMAELISALYAIPVPTRTRTTFNVGTVSGGSTVNAIAEECSIVYEYRSEDDACLREMEHAVQSVRDRFAARGIPSEQEILGIRPGSGPADVNALSSLTEKAVRVLQPYNKDPVSCGAGSTDANVPLSLGIPAVTYGTCVGGGSHTRGEWVDLNSIRSGIEIAVKSLLTVIS